MFIKLSYFFFGYNCKSQIGKLFCHSGLDIFCCFFLMENNYEFVVINGMSHSRNDSPKDKANENQ